MGSGSDGHAQPDANPGQAGADYRRARRGGDVFRLFLPVIRFNGSPGCLADGINQPLSIISQGPFARTRFTNDAAAVIFFALGQVISDGRPLA